MSMYIKWRLAQVAALACAFRVAWKRMWQIGIGDTVHTTGRRLLILNGVSAPMWDVQDRVTAEFLRCHERDMRKERTLRNYIGSFRSGWNWWMKSWFEIDVGRRLGFNGAYYGTDGYLARRQRRFDRRYVREASKRIAERALDGAKERET